MESPIEKLDGLMKLLADSKRFLTIEQTFEAFKVTHPDIEQLVVQQLLLVGICNPDLRAKDFQSFYSIIKPSN